jgi:hypothetical protein
MRHFLLLAFVATTLLPVRAAWAQEANQNEMQAITQIAQCMAEGLPDDWVAAHMLVELSAPGDNTGGVRYLAARKDAEDKLEPFTPCDTDKPAKILVGLRDLQPPERRGWISARLVVERDGSFRVNYEFPK